MVLSDSIRNKVAFITLGCAKNEVDSSRMQEKILSSGFIIEEDPAQADAIIVNTCSFIQAATEESLEVIFDVMNLSSVMHDETKIIVSGCMPARYGDELTQELPEVQAFVPCSEEENIVEVLVDVLGQAPQQEELDFECSPLLEARGPSGEPSVYVKISDGCNRFCSFCTIPYIRGRYHSFLLQDILNEVDRAVCNGAREIVLIAQDTGRWGTDFDEPSSLAELIDTLAQQFNTTWFRVMYIQPEGINDDLIAAVKAHENVCSYFDIPFQHVDKGILKAMNRKGSQEEYLQLIGRIRSEIPDVTLRTTLIAGFPGESEESFEDLCSFVEQAELDYVGVFPYSQEEGTRSAELSGQIEEEEKLRRAQELRDIADLACTPRIASRVGAELEVLVLGNEEDGQLFGRAKSQAPDVDGVTYLQEGSIGEVRRVTITDTLLYEMEGN